MEKLGLFIFIAAMMLIFNFFIYNQWHLVNSAPIFISIVLIFVTLAFFCSAMETAFSNASTDNKILQSLQGDSEKIATRYAEFDQIVKNGVSIRDFDPVQKEKFYKLERDAIIQRNKEASLGPMSRSVFVGTFASLSVFLNIALAAMLPYALIDGNGVKIPLGLSFPYPYGASLDSIKISWINFDLSGKATLVFFASAFPILIIGKVIPKEIGVIFAHFFAYRLNRVARILVAIFGFIPKALRAPLNALNRYVKKGT